MRWTSQDVDHDAAGRLPGIGGGVIRRFDAPEALDIRFHEIRTKSALNRVPRAARLPFDWTVNPYRGCTHACVYCLAPDTPVLLASGRARAIADLRAGEEIYGTVREGVHRRYVRTEVLAHWSTVKPAFRVTLDDGTELVTSGDHRLLTLHGWKSVEGASRVRLTGADRLVGTGGFAPGPVEGNNYRRGYLSGLIRGGSDLWPDAGVQGSRFRLALADHEALERARRYLDHFAVPTGESTPAGAGSRPLRELHSEAIDDIAALVARPRAPGDSWHKGFLAGIFDAAGLCAGSLRIPHAERALVEQTAEGLRRLGFTFAVESAHGLGTVRLLGGVPDQQRFFFTVDPAITRKRGLEGRMVRFHGRLRVASVEPLGSELEMFDITTGTGDFVANGVVSHNCFARPTHEFLDMNAGRDFEREIIVKVNVPEVLRAELARPSWGGASVALGTNTDPYQWVEGRYKLMRGIWEAMRDFQNPCSILTKSPLLLRDLDLLKEIAAVADVSACLSIPTLDEKAWRATEPHTPNPHARMEAVAELNRNGIPTGVLVAPLMPGINDAPQQIERLVELATEADATYIGGQTLFLRGAVRDIFFEWLRAHRPDLLRRYERLYAEGAYLTPADRRKIELAAGAPWVVNTYPRDRYRHRGARRPPPAPEPAPPRVRQESLF